MNNVKGRTGEPAQRWAHLTPLVISILLVVAVLVFLSWGAHSFAEQISQIKTLIQQSQAMVCGA